MARSPDADRRVLVLDGDSQASLSVVSSLGSRGVAVTVGNDAPNSVGSHSRYVDSEFVYPDPAVEPAAFADELRAFLDDTDHFAVLPTRDDTTTVVSRHKRRLAATDTVVAVEDWPRFRRATDKERTFELAGDLDVPTPDTRAPESLADAASMAGDLPYPVVVKSRSKHVADSDGRLYTHEVGDSDYARTPLELVSTYRRLLAADAGTRSEPPIVQEYVEGQTTTTVGVADAGEFLAHFQELRLRTTPASGGSSTLITGFKDETMREYAGEVVAALDWTGPIQVEFMWTPDDEFYLVEVNGRYWGSTPLAVASGVDIPWLHYSLLTGERPEIPETYRDDVVQQRLLYGDLKWLGEQLEDGNVAAVGPFLRALWTDDQVFVRPDDPMTTVAALRQAAELGAGAVRDAVTGRF
ncbi:carboxylate--amine ligase [Halobacterium litoreum]|uniref:ATP-grasp domain-containing protein n=1 Tax=Halobacterium litoreum TaxID=2039234 RepID=A0ABD5NBM3_9EURY|nr:ATP-grasp domain-containing protein [Halobacterium litoreum]UHH14661.1 ATP-grasp domain-containing protein [Halobacterium litoreum]